MSPSDYAAKYGLEYSGLSMDALKALTRFASAEFAVRAFIMHDSVRAMSTMLLWISDDAVKVRRLSSKGCCRRPPWGAALKRLKLNPAPILPILEAPKMTGPRRAETVRNSVPNSLSDIAEDHPDLVLDICQRWYGHCERTNRIVHRVLRTLLKAGHPSALKLVGLDRQARTSVSDLTVTPARARIGDRVLYSFDLLVQEEQAICVRLELRVD